MRHEASPCSILGTTVDVGTVFQQHLDNLGPASRGRLVESCVTGVIAPIDLPDVLLKAVLDYILQSRGKTDGLCHINMVQRRAPFIGVKFMLLHQ